MCERIRKALVTGGAGFIGSEFVRQAVRKEYETIVVDKLTYAGDLTRLREVEGCFKFYKADITNREFIDYIFEHEKPDIVVHFAAESHVDRSIRSPSIFIDSNVKGTLTLLEASRKYGIERFINVSSDEIYGELGDTGSFSEDSPLRPNSPYSASKAAQDMLGKVYFRTHSVPVIAIRPCNNYGLFQHTEKLIPKIIHHALSSKYIPVYGNGLNIREWIYVFDCVEAIFVIIEKGNIGEVYNIGSGVEKTNIELVRYILRLMNKSEKLICFVEDRPGHDYRYFLDSNKVRNELNWNPKTSFEDGIKETINWYKLKYSKTNRLAFA